MQICLEIAIEEGIIKIFGDSKLVVEYWSKGHIKYEVGEETVNLAHEVKILRKEFEKMGGKMILISGGAIRQIWVFIGTNFGYNLKI